MDSATMLPVKIQITLSRNGKILVSEVLINPHATEITNAGIRVFETARYIVGHERLWDYNISARELSNNRADG